MGFESTARCVAIGASWGGIAALQKLCAELDPGLSAAVFVVQHVGAYSSQLAELLGRAGPLPCRAAEDGDVIQGGIIYVAPPDRHMLVEGPLVRLSAGPKENHARPAIDPLFRSAAVSYRERCIGVILTGLLDDGTVGMDAIKRCGGVTVVQDPLDAERPDMPRSAIENVSTDYILPLHEIPAQLNALCNIPARATAVEVPAYVREEHAMTEGRDIVARLNAQAKPSALTCPDCGGALFELKQNPPVRYRCHIGHAFTLKSLASWQAEVMEEALWSAVRAPGERQMILSRSLEQAGNVLPTADRQDLEAEIERLSREIESLRELTVGSHGRG